MYHYTRDLAHSRYPNIKGLAYDLFEQQLQFFAAHFSVVTMEAVIHALEPDGKPLPEHALLLTFDDGYIDNFTVALPLLKKYGMQGSFFIPGKTFSENVLLDVNKIHFVLASADNPKELVHDLFQLLDEARRGPEYRDIPDNESLYAHYAAANRFDSADGASGKTAERNNIGTLCTIRGAVRSKFCAGTVHERRPDQLPQSQRHVHRTPRLRPLLAQRTQQG